MSTSLLMFLGFIAITLGITYWASKRTKTTTEFYSAGRSLTGFQNGWAVAGDYMSAASFLGIAGLPHILVRFYTVPSAKAARTSVVWAMILIGSFYIMTTFLGFGAATLVGKGNIGVHVTGAAATSYIAQHPDTAAALTDQLNKVGYIVPATNSNLAAPLLAEKLGGGIFLSFIAAIAFATILAVVAGLTIASSSAFAHDIWFNVVKGGEKHDEREQVRVARITAAVIGVLAIGLAITLRSLNVAFLVGLAFAVAASANVPAIVLTLFWRRFNTTGMVMGMIVGLVASLVLIVLSPAVMGVDPPTAAVRHVIQAAPIFPLENPGIVSVPLGFIAAVVGSLLTRDERAERPTASSTCEPTPGWAPRCRVSCLDEGRKT